jgi:hypothetical protein
MWKKTKLVLKREPGRASAEQPFVFFIDGLGLLYNFVFAHINLVIFYVTIKEQMQISLGVKSVVLFAVSPSELSAWRLACAPRVHGWDKQGFLAVMI